MTAALIPWIGIPICLAGGMLVYAFEKTLHKLIGLFLLFLGGSVLLLQACSFQTCLALLVCGIGTSVLLGSGKANRETILFGKFTEKTAFRLLLAVILAVLSYTLAERLRFWIPARRTVLFIVLWVSMLAIIGLSLDDVLLTRSIYLQCLCLAFTVVYIYMENSVLVFGCFAAINLLMAFGSAILVSGRETSRTADAEERGL